MRFARRHAVLFWAISAWNVVTYATFTRNLWSAYALGEDRPTGYWVAHTVLIVVNLVVAVVLARLGLRVWRGADQTSRTSSRASTVVTSPTKTTASTQD